MTRFTWLMVLVAMLAALACFACDNEDGEDCRAYEVCDASVRTLLFICGKSLEDAEKAAGTIKEGCGEGGCSFGGNRTSVLEDCADGNMACIYQDAPDGVSKVKALTICESEAETDGDAEEEAAADGDVDQEAVDGDSEEEALDGDADPETVDAEQDQAGEGDEAESADDSEGGESQEQESEADPVEDAENG